LARAEIEELERHSRRRAQRRRVRQRPPGLGEIDLHLREALIENPELLLEAGLACPIRTLVGSRQAVASTADVLDLIR
jgi:hypothetical protein